jgi:hypothetical protein
LLAALRFGFGWAARACCVAWWLGCVVGCLGLAVLSKETGLTAGAVLLVVDLLRDPPPKLPASLEPAVRPAGGGQSHDDAAAAAAPAPAAAANPGAKANARHAAAARWHWRCVGLRAVLLAALAVVYLGARVHVMTPGGLIVRATPPLRTSSSRSSRTAVSSSSSGGAAVSSRAAASSSSSSGPPRAWRVAWERVAWNSISLDTSGLIRKAENPFSLLPPRSLAR